MPGCDVAGCESNSKRNPEYIFHHVPRTPETRARWLELMGAPTGRRCPVVCSRHFAADAYSSGPRGAAVRRGEPTLFLPKPAESYEAAQALDAKEDEMCLKKIDALKKKLAKARRDLRDLRVKRRERENPQGSTERAVKAEAPGPRACRACLAAGPRLFDARDAALDDVFADLSGQPFSVVEGLRHLCGFCCAELSKFAEFRERCHRTSELLQVLAARGALTTDDILAIDRESHELTPNLTKANVFKFDSEETESFSPQTIKTEIVNEHTHNERPKLFDVVVEEGTPDNDIKIEETEPENKLEQHDLFPEKNAGDSKVSTNAAKTTEPTKTTITTTPAKTTKRTRAKSDNTKIPCKRKRKRMYDDVYPGFDYAEFEKRYNVKIDLLTIEQQKQEIENKKYTDNYLKSSHRCEICGKGFNFEKTLKNHMGYHDPSVGPYECEICHFRFKHSYKKVKHRDLHRMYFTCQQCGFVARDRAHFRRHYDTHQGKVHKCAHCPLTFARASTCLSHARLAHPARGVACAACGETFLSRLGVMHHAARAHRPCLQPRCDVCNASFSSAEALERHKSSVTEETHLTHRPCLVCGEHCAGEEALAAHAQRTHPPAQFRCEECDENFASAASFEHHTRRKHLGERFYVGPPRPRRSHATHASHASHGAHARVGVVCEICGKVMPNRTLLRYHQHGHLARKPFACPHCDKTFAIKKSRDWHILTHTGEKPFQCELCSQAFSIRSNLRRHHKVVHLGQRPLASCPLCGKQLSAPAAVRLHVDTVHHRKPMPRRPPRRRKPPKPAA